MHRNPWPVALTAACLMTSATLPAVAQTDDKAAAVLAATHKAIGNDGKWQSLTSLGVEGTFRRVAGDREMSGDLELAMLLPGRYQRVERFQRPDGMPGPAIAMTVDGEEGWAGPVGGAGGGMVMMRFGDGPRGPGDPGDRPGGPRREPDPAAIARRLRPEFLRVLVGMLPGAPFLSDLSYKYVAEAESPDGKADVLEVTGPDDFQARLFIDQSTHLPLMLTFKAPDSRRSMRIMTERGPANLSPEERQKRMEERRKQMEAEGPPPPPPEVEHALYFDRHDKVDGLLLPKHMSHSIAGSPNEEWELDKIKVNGSIKPEQFKKP